jgi:hydrogenase maturation factor
MHANQPLPLGKLPPDLLAAILRRAPLSDPRVLQGPGIGLDCAVIDLGERLLVIKSDPITFASAEIGWYLVQVNANDIATTGAEPRWLLVTALLPEGRSSAASVERIAGQVYDAAGALGISVIGGHTEVTAGLKRPVLAGTLIGEVARERLVSPGGALPGDRLLLSGGVPIEATALLARELPGRLRGWLTDEEIREAADFLYHPGIGVVAEARAAATAGGVHAMHDPTEGGLFAAVWEMARACGLAFTIDPRSVPVPSLSARVCRAFGIDPLAAIASGALLLAVDASHSGAVSAAIQAVGVDCVEIGRVTAGPAAAWREEDGRREPLPLPERDEVARVFEQTSPHGPRHANR